MKENKTEISSLTFAIGVGAGIILYKVIFDFLLPMLF